MEESFSYDHNEWHSIMNSVLSSSLFDNYYVLKLLLIKGQEFFERFAFASLSPVLFVRKKLLSCSVKKLLEKNVLFGMSL